MGRCVLVMVSGQASSGNSRLDSEWKNLPPPAEKAHTQYELFKLHDQLPYILSLAHRKDIYPSIIGKGLCLGSCSLKDL